MFLGIDDTGEFIEVMIRANSNSIIIQKEIKGEFALPGNVAKLFYLEFNI